MRTLIIHHRRLHWPSVLLTLAACIVLAGAVALIVAHVTQQGPLPASVRSQVHFPAFIPAHTVKVDAASYKYDTSQNLLSFTGHLQDGQTVTFAEQPAPSSFTDIPDFYQKFLQALFDYQSFDSLAGTVHLTHPKGAGQAAVMSAKGTLIFARVAHDESQGTWTEVFNDLQVYAP